MISAPIGFENDVKNFVEQVSSVDLQTIDSFLIISIMIMAFGVMH